MRTCEMYADYATRTPCLKPATFYVMQAGAGGWGGRACDEHAENFPIKERLK